MRDWLKENDKPPVPPRSTNLGGAASAPAAAASAAGGDDGAKGDGKEGDADPAADGEETPGGAAAGADKKAPEKPKEPMKAHKSTYAYRTGLQPGRSDALLPNVERLLAGEDPQKDGYSSDDGTRSELTWVY